MSIEIIKRERDKYGYSTESRKFTELRMKFASAVTGANAFTPVLVGYVEHKDMIVEVSTGNDRPGPSNLTFNDKYGVTVVRDGKVDHSKSKLCFSYKEMEAYIESL